MISISALPRSRQMSQASTKKSPLIRSMLMNNCQGFAAPALNVSIPEPWSKLSLIAIFAAQASITTITTIATPLGERGMLFEVSCKLPSGSPLPLITGVAFRQDRMLACDSWRGLSIGLAKCR